MKELSCDVAVIGGSLGGVAAALAAARLGKNVILTEETEWIGGQATTQGVPLDEHPWIESYGRTLSYHTFRQEIREYYRRNYPLTPEARSDPFLNPGAAWVTALGYEPRVGLAVLYEMLAPYLSAGSVRILTRHRPVAVSVEGDRIEAVTVTDQRDGSERTVHATYFLDATELGNLLPMAGVEHVIGAESQSETGEPNALPGEADPMDQMGFTHVIAFDYLPGEDHTIGEPEGYNPWRNPPGGSSKFNLPDLFGVERDNFGRPPRVDGYVAATWSFRRILFKGNFADGVFPSDITVAIWGGNEYREGVLLGVAEDEQKRHLAAARNLSLGLLYYLQTEAPDPATGREGYPELRPRGDVFGSSDGCAQYPYIRESRRIQAEFTVLEQHFRRDLPGQEDGPMKYSDSVGVGGYRVDIHKPAKKGGKGSMTAANHGMHWPQQIPLGALIPVRMENLLPACKNLGVTSVTNGAFRLHPVEWNIGEAAGALAAFCLTRSTTPRSVRNTPVELEDFQRSLVKQGLELDWPRMQFARSYYSHYGQGEGAGDWYFGEASRRSLI